ncbi:hypothetical protein F4809DRAFT_658924 [Biscogniauxia mediterranea]|nr:hypothetical protein F4809DRAFT_658924 [Biscogniauxia mediterranea]
MASETMVTISRQSLQPTSNSSATITDVKHLASYSWIEAPTPTIAVPGVPPRWSPPKHTRTLPKDSGLVYIAQNAARHPASPLEPLFRALYITNPKFDVRSVDVVTDRNNIRKLFTFIDPSSSRYGLESFTINVEATESTVIFSRDETATQEVIRPHEFRGFGHEFEKAYTTCEMSDSTGHHRISSYHFGGLSFIVRYEADAYVEDHSGMISHRQKSDPDALTNLLGSFSLSPSVSPAKATKIAGSQMAIRKQGRMVPLESILEIKTRAASKRISLSDVALQLWVSQTPKLVRAHHYRGAFEQPTIEDVTDKIRDWEHEKQTSLRKLATLIRKVISVVKGFDGGKGVIKYDRASDTLTITKVDRTPMLPKDLYSKWDAKKLPGTDVACYS